MVVVSYNACELLCRCLDAVEASAREVVVVDNASSDSSADLVESRYPGARAVVLERNIGFGAAANIGIRETEGRYILLLNADAWPVGRGVDILVEAAEQSPRIALLGPQLVDDDGKPQRSVIRHPSGGTELALTTLLPHALSGAYTAWRRLTGAHRPRPVEGRNFLIGAALLLRRSALEQVGLFDESFFMYDEEVDLCFRLRRAGWRIEFCPSATFVHIGGASTAAVPLEMNRERLRSHLRFLAKDRGWREAESARRLLMLALRLRRQRAEAVWLADTPLETLLKSSP